MARMGGLGRGLASLIPQRKKNEDKEATNYFGRDDKNKIFQKDNLIQNIQVDQKEKGKINLSIRSILEIKIDNIVPNPYQPRKVFNEEKLQELADSIKRHGILQPLVVSKIKDNQYELIAGERRLEASKIAGLEQVPVIIRNPKEEEKLELALIENIQRHNLNLIEEARAYKKMQERFGFTQEEIATKMGKSRPVITNLLRLLNLPIEIQRALLNGKITEGHARMILSINNPEKQRALFELILKDSLTVRQTEKKVKEVNVSSYKRKLIAGDPNIKEKEERISSALGTKVKIKKNNEEGQIVIDFYSEEEFGNLCEKLSA